MHRNRLQTYVAQLPRVGRQLRAAAVVVLLLVWLLQALPGKPYDAERAALPENQRTFARVAESLQGVAIPVSSELLQRGLVEGSATLVAWRRAALRPIEPLFQQLQMDQRWGLFLSRSRTAHRLVIEGRSAHEPWQLLYRAPDVDLKQLGTRLSFRRLRGIYNSPRSRETPREQYDGFVRWVARTLFAEDGALTEVRVGLERLRVGTREKPTRALRVEHLRTERREES